jgi:hypothetical protein
MTSYVVAGTASRAALCIDAVRGTCPGRPVTVELAR